MKLLWLDDDYFILQDLASILKLNGFEILFCEDVNSAIEAIKMNKDISLFILDMMLPPAGLFSNSLEETQGGKITGYIFYKQFIKPNFGDTPVIILSALAYEKIIGIDRDSNNLILVRKPIDSEELLKIIRQKIKPAANTQYSKKR